MTSVNLSAKSPATVKADVLVLGIAQTKGEQVKVLGDLPGPLRKAAQTAIDALQLTGAADQVTRFPSAGQAGAPVIALTGLGALGESGPSCEQLRRAAGAAVRESGAVRSLALALPAADGEAAAAITEGALLGAYRYQDYKQKQDPPVESVTVICEQSRSKATKTAIDAAQVTAAAVNAARDLVNCPPLDLYPNRFAEIAQARSRQSAVKVTVMDEQALAKAGYGGLVAVGQGSSRPPRLVRLSYSPRGAAKHVALVGKGITFDSGGLSIKPAAGMEEMKSDMAGAAAVLSTVLAAAELGLGVKVTGYLCLAENMPSGTAQRPSDVIRIYGGKTVEVLNTDAEGRLVLADAIAAASEEHPDAILDVATLTGAQIVALGKRVSAVMGDQSLRDAVCRAAEQRGEQFWPMPLPEELRKPLDSTVADLANIGDRWGGMLSAGIFLREFVGRVGKGKDDPRIPWAHLDIAGPSYTTTAHGYTPKGGTGVAIRTLLGVLESYC